MSRVTVFMNGPGAAFVLAVVIFVVALVGHQGLGLALATAGVMVVYGVVLFVGRRSDFIGVLAAPGADERAWSAHMRAAATSGQVMAAIIVGGFLYDLARGSADHSQWLWLGVAFGVTYLVALLITVRRGS